MQGTYSYEDLIFIYNILHKYSRLFSEAIDKQYEYLDEMYKYKIGIDGVKEYEKSDFKRFIEASAGRIVSTHAKLVTLNNLSSRIQDVSTLMKFIYKYEILELDKHVIPILEKQLKLKNIIKNRGSITAVRINAYSSLFGLLDDAYTECVHILENCLYVLSKEIKNRIENDDQKDNPDYEK